MAAKLCYSPSSVDELDEKVKGISYAKFLGKVVGMGHHSVLEHASFTFGIDGISRSTSHQLVRHRIASYSQQSQRYVKNDKNNEYITPESISKNPEFAKRFESAVADIYALYGEMTEAGIPAEDARFILPNASCTKIIVTMNARSLLHFFTLRGCERAQWEIRAMAIEMIGLAKEVAPIIFADAGPACVRGACSEGAMTCGHPKEIREKFKNL